MSTKKRYVFGDKPRWAVIIMIEDTLKGSDWLVEGQFSQTGMSDCGEGRKINTGGDTGYVG